MPATCSRRTWCRKQADQRRKANFFDNPWKGELSGLGEAILREGGFELQLESGEGQDPMVLSGSIGRVDRLSGDGVEVLDYETGSVSSQKRADEPVVVGLCAGWPGRAGLGTPERVTLHFTESATRHSTTRTDDQLDAARDDILARVARIRSSDFAATPRKPCGWFAYQAMCPERV